MNNIGLIAICLCVILETIEQITYKFSVKIPKKTIMFIFIGIVFHILRLAIWYQVLKIIPIGIALPLTGASYITITLGSDLLFKEKLDTQYWIGVSVIVIGFLIISVNM